jgi:hypothetical protein
MSREAHVRFCEGVGVRFPRATRLFSRSKPHISKSIKWKYVETQMHHLLFTLNLYSVF